MANTDDNKLILVSDLLSVSLMFDSIQRRLNTDVHSPCYLLHIRDVNLLLDCCMDLSNLSYFLPKHQLMRSVFHIYQLQCIDAFSPGCSDLPNMWSGHEEGGMVSSLLCNVSIMHIIIFYILVYQNRRYELSQYGFQILHVKIIRGFSLFVNFKHYFEIINNPRCLPYFGKLLM